MFTDYAICQQIVNLAVSTLSAIVQQQHINEIRTMNILITHPGNEVGSGKKKTMNYALITVEHGKHASNRLQCILLHRHN